MSSYILGGIFMYSYTIDIPAIFHFFSPLDLKIIKRRLEFLCQPN